MYTLIFPYDCTSKNAAFVCYYEGMTSPGCINERRVDPRSMSAAYVALLLFPHPLWLPQVLNQCTCLSHVRAGALT